MALPAASVLIGISFLLGERGPAVKAHSPADNGTATLPALVRAAAKSQLRVLIRAASQMTAGARKATATGATYSRMMSVASHGTKLRYCSVMSGNMPQTEIARVTARNQPDG